MSSDSTSHLAGRALSQRIGMSNWLSQFSRPQRPPTLVINPANDSVFEATVKNRLREVATPEALQEALRSQYPEVVVHRRELSSEPITMWYVYRDGRWRG
jgi:hypothetical protein